MTEIESLRDTVSKVSRDLEELRRDTLRTRRQLSEGEQIVRLARTMKDTASTYPVPTDDPYAFEIIFLDGTYTSTVGQQAITQTDQDDVSQELAWSAVWVDEGQLVEVFEQDNRWWISKVLGDLEDQLFVIKTESPLEDNWLDPGGSATGILWQWDDVSAYEESTEQWEVTLYDRTSPTNTQGRNCALPGDWVTARINPRNNRWEVVGSFGLERKCSLAAIAAGSSGVATLFYANVATTITVTAHYNHAEGTAIAVDTEGWVRWHPEETKWIVTARAGC